MAQSFPGAGQAPSGNASVSGAMGPLVNLMRQMQSGMNFGTLDNEAMKGINNAEGNVESLFRNQMQGFHQNTGGSLLKQLSANRSALQKRGLGGAVSQLGDMGTDRNYQMTMGKLRDSWFSNLLGQKTGFMKQRTGVANQSSNRLSSILAQLSGASAGLIGANTPKQNYLPPQYSPTAAGGQYLSNGQYGVTGAGGQYLR